MILKHYQERKVQELYSSILRLTGRDTPGSIVFEAPTGSGKTVMIEECLRRISETPLDREYAYIWISVNDLSRQSKRSFERNLSGSPLRFSELADIRDGVLAANEILFINWESIRSVDRGSGTWKNIAMRDNERDAHLPRYLENTHALGRGIILIVDESHRSLSTSKAQDLIRNYIRPQIQIEVSATPDSIGYDERISVGIESVIEAGMIKKEILINPDLSDISKEQETDILILAGALRKARELREAYESVGSSVRPLVLIQLPSESRSTTPLDHTKLTRTLRILEREFGITFLNHRLALWLSDDKQNLEGIENPESPVEVLIFKQAIATGWDCPRAHILVMFREIGSVTFEIQTIGRILRMPEQRHYDLNILNIAYVYTDLERANIGIHETARNIIKDRFSKRRSSYENIQLLQRYLRRTEYHDLGHSFYGVLSDIFLRRIGSDRHAPLLANQEKLRQSRVKIDDIHMHSRLITDGRILVDIDHRSGESVYAETCIETRTEEELVKIAFDVFAREQVRPQFTNIARSYKTIIEALYVTLEDFCFGRGYSRYYFQCLILSNQEFFIDLLTDAKEAYLHVRRAELISRHKNEIREKLYEVPTIVAFPEDASHMEVKRSIMEPFYTGSLSEGERIFIEHYLEKDLGVRWWYRNGVNSEQFFSIVYTDDDGEIRNFFPDFIVMHEDGTIGIYDPKDGFTLEAGRSKHRALMRYLEEVQAGGVSVTGGFVRHLGTEHIGFYRTVSNDYAVETMRGWERM